MGIITKSEREIALMREAGNIVGRVLELLRNRIESGMKTQELDDIAEGVIENFFTLAAHVQAEGPHLHYEFLTFSIK